jgi:hypothetical protein
VGISRTQSFAAARLPARYALIAAILSLLASAVAAAPEDRQLSCTVASGREAKCTSHAGYGQGREWPVSVTVTVPPANGKVTIRTVEETSKNGSRVHATAIFYQSKPGFVGQDSFSYQRHSDDPTDRFNGPHVMTVTVK